MHKLDMYKLGRRIAAARVLADLTQQALADRAEIPQSALARIERGRRPQLSVGTLYAIAQALGVSTDYLLGLKEEEDEPAQAVAG
jgi:transcriptional regulator with XRE-family HTH domain